MGRAIWRAASRLREAQGFAAAEEAASQAFSYRSRGDQAGFDIWSLIFFAIRALEQGEGWGQARGAEPRPRPAARPVGSGR
ncbi:MAG: hypothetical protein ACREFW_05675 [Rhizomicrobium sp.]